MKSKKIFFLILMIIVFCLILLGCKSSADNSNNNQETSIGIETSTTANSDTSALAATETIKEDLPASSEKQIDGKDSEPITKNSNNEIKTNWETILTNDDVKLDGLTWDGNNFWVITYNSSPIEWKIAKLKNDGSIDKEFKVECKSRDDVHNFGCINLAYDGKNIWMNNWNEGFIYSFDNSGKILKHFTVASINHLIPVGLTFENENLWVFSWSDKTLYQLDKEGNETGKKIDLSNIKPDLDIGLVWDGKNFWVGSRWTNVAIQLTYDGKPTGFIKGPKDKGGIRDLAWDGKKIYWIYQQGHEIFGTELVY
ncbi:MAG: hypothetical protein M1409_00205 [Actinobacteria bacterium]|nr:hypothetical protein [Actinomycetota bacterium]